MRDVIGQRPDVTDGGPADESGGQPTAEVTGLAVFNFGDFGAKVAEKKGSERSLYFLRDFDKFDLLKRFAHPLCFVKMSVRSCVEFLRYNAANDLTAPHLNCALYVIPARGCRARSPGRDASQRIGILRARQPRARE